MFYKNTPKDMIYNECLLRMSIETNTGCCKTLNKSEPMIKKKKKIYLLTHLKRLNEMSRLPLFLKCDFCVTTGNFTVMSTLKLRQGIKIIQSYCIYLTTSAPENVPPS